MICGVQWRQFPWYLRAHAGLSPRDTSTGGFIIDLVIVKKEAKKLKKRVKIQRKFA